MVMSQLVSFLGIFVMFGIAFLFSIDKKAIKWPPIIFGFILQIVFALLVLKTKPGFFFFKTVNDLVMALMGFTSKGTEMVFNALALPDKGVGFVFAFQVLPTIIFFSALMSILYYLGIMQKIVELIAKVIIKVMGTSGAETLCCSANIFMGQTEAPLLIRPYIEKATKSEMLAVMTGGFATMAAGVIAFYVSILKDYVPTAAGHILTASIISAPGALMMAKIMFPETEEPITRGSVKVSSARTDANVIDAAANGTIMGLQLALNVGAMLIAFVALIHMCNAFLGWIGSGFNYIFHTGITLNFETIFGIVFSPFAFIIGVPWKDCVIVGNLLGKMVTLNELIAYSELSNLLKNPMCSLDPRSVIIAIYALCGFANISSIGIQIGGIGGMAPSRKSDLAKIGPYGLIAGLLVCYETAAIAGLLIPSEQIYPGGQKTESLKDSGKIVQYQEFPGRKTALRQHMERSFPGVQVAIKMENQR